jgi:hypothetical protein
MYANVPSNAAVLNPIDEGKGSIGGRRECIIGMMIGDNRRVVTPDAIAICCVSVIELSFLLNLVLLLDRIAPLSLLRLLLLLPNARSLRLFFLPCCIVSMLLLKSFVALLLLLLLVSSIIGFVRRDDNAREIVLLSMVERADAITSSSNIGVMSDVDC